jgi:hypothetical protein
MNGMWVRVLLELDPAVEPIGGMLSVNGGRAVPFSGWLALGRELDAALAAARPAQSARKPTDE